MPLTQVPSLDSPYLERCRGCGTFQNRDDMTAASKVLKRTARGWFCHDCIG